MLQIFFNFTSLILLLFLFVLLHAICSLFYYLHINNYLINLKKGFEKYLMRNYIEIELRNI